MTDSASHKCDVCVIGAGLAGMAATLFAANRGLSVVQVGRIGEILFSSGLLDLLGVHPFSEKRSWSDPLSPILALLHVIPRHPYARVKREQIEAAFDEILKFLQQNGLRYRRQVNRNSDVLTPLGTVKSTYAVPHTMWKGVAALKEKPDCLFIDIRGLKAFSARQIATTLQSRWPGVRSAQVSFPDSDHLSEIYAEHMANALSLPANREKFAQAVSPHIKDSEILGLPAILGMHRTDEVFAHLEALIGRPLFEIPTIPPSIAGLRLKNAFESGLRPKGVQYLSMHRVLQVRPTDDRLFTIRVGRDDAEDIVHSRAIILATGRFIGGGLHADRKRIRETLFDLPVYQPESRADWHRRNFLDPSGHRINQAGLQIDSLFRPLDDSGRPCFETLFAAGSILAHNDWKRMKCGAGTAIVTAFGAVNAITRSLSV